MSINRNRCLRTLLFYCLSMTVCGRLIADDLRAGFIAPPNTARPRVWWHWIDGVVSEEGVKLDLEWMKRIGLGGLQHFDVAIGSTAPDRGQALEYGSPQWRSAMRRSIAQANKLGLEFTIASSAGWSETGGPWVRPAQAMKKIAWSETVLSGEHRFSGLLNRPPATTGPFQDIPTRWFVNGEMRLLERPEYYRDVAVIAYRLPNADIPSDTPLPVITSSIGSVDGALFFDGDLTRTFTLPFEHGREQSIQLTFAKSQRVQAITSYIGHPLGLPSPLRPLSLGRLEASENGVTFRKVAEIPLNAALQQTISFPPVTSKVFRMVLVRPDSTATELLGLSTRYHAHEIAELKLHTEARVNRFEDKAGFSSRQITNADDTPTVAPRDLVQEDEVIDVSEHMTSDGYFDWTPPPGQWVVLRFGYSLTGSMNRPAPEKGTGLEVDKLNRSHVNAYIETYLEQYSELLGPEGAGGNLGFQSVITDSNEAGPQNWTDDLLEQFERRRGYSARRWLPVLAGRVIASAVESDRFLWDFRKTLSELIAEAHYGEITNSLHRRGIRRYGQAHEAHRRFIGDGMEVKRTADFPMGAFWSSNPPEYTQQDYDADIRESASVAHIYGQNIVAAESFTASGNTYGFAPETLKPAADRAMSMGVNQFVIHTSAHQPDSKAGPGISLGPYGLWFTRKEVWADYASPWIDYLARSSYLLQQGRFVADIAYLYGEDSNITSLFGTRVPVIPNGYSFDFINADALANEITISDSKLQSRAGMHYRVLVLDESTSRMSVPVLRKIRNLVRAGAVVIGPRPIQTPSLADDENEFRSITGELWGSSTSQTGLNHGRVISDQPNDRLFQVLNIPPDVKFFGTAASKIRFVHRHLPEGGDVYFVSYAGTHPLTVTTSFRVSGRRPELWRADTGITRPLSFEIKNERTVVPLSFGPQDAMFVIFRQPISEHSAVVPQPSCKILSSANHSWNVAFSPGLGAPIRAHFKVLSSWTESEDDGIKYFSGTATYTNDIQVHPSWAKGNRRVEIDLGVVKSVAEISVNGQPIGILWKSPFRIDVTKAVKVGSNNIEVKVANLWPNRLIGDKQPKARQIAFAAFNPFSSDSPLLPSGLLGPVRIIGCSF
jgi:alpha-L-rhamnosidase/Glycosyl hydrolases family 2, sugar binding domain